MGDDTAYVVESVVEVRCNHRFASALKAHLAPNASVSRPEVECAADGRTIRVVCHVNAPTLQQAKDLVTAALTQGIRLAAPGSEAPVRARGIGILLPPRTPTLPTTEQWGWYRVTVVLKGEHLRSDPYIREFMIDELPRMRRFEDGYVQAGPGDDAVTVSLRTIGRSQDAAYGETCDAIDRMLTASERERGEYTIEIVEARWLRPIESPGSGEAPDV
jgi:hypothetical protein